MQHKGLTWKFYLKMKNENKRYLKLFYFSIYISNT